MQFTHSEVAVGNERAHAQFESDCDSSLIRLLCRGCFWPLPEDFAKIIECPGLQCAVARVTNNGQGTFNRFAGAIVLLCQAVCVGQVHEAHRSEVQKAPRLRHVPRALKHWYSLRCPISEVVRVPQTPGGVNDRTRKIRAAPLPEAALQEGNRRDHHSSDDMRDATC